MAPVDAVRAELRAALRDISDALLDGIGRHRLHDAVRHAWILADLAEIGEGPVRAVLRDLARELRGGTPTDSTGLANQTTRAADQLDE